jgi:VanZ family protein
VSRRLLLLIVFLFIAAGLLFVPLPIPPTYAGRTIENAGHTPLFMFVTFGVLFYLRSDLKLSGAPLYAWAFLVGLGSGFLSEIIQKPLRRDASWEDVWSDFIGVILAIAVFALFDRQARMSRAVRFCAVVLVLTSAAFYLAPLVTMTRAYLHRNGQFPVIADFRASAELSWIVGYGINRSIVRDALDIEFHADEFPGVSLYEPVPDWSGFENLALDLENPDADPLVITVRVHDRGHGREYNDRYNRSFDLAPQERRTLRIPLDEIRRGPRQRLMNMRQISDITVFRRTRSGSQHLRLYSVRLE